MQFECLAQLQAAGRDDSTPSALSSDSPIIRVVATIAKSRTYASFLPKTCLELLFIGTNCGVDTECNSPYCRVALRNLSLLSHATLAAREHPWQGLKYELHDH